MSWTDELEAMGPMRIAQATPAPCLGEGLKPLGLEVSLRSVRLEADVALHRVHP